VCRRRVDGWLAAAAVVGYAYRPLGDGIRAQALVGSMFAAVGAYASVRFLLRWFQTRTLTPFAIYCLAVGTLSIVHFW
jgi:undecaprenyl-diphosphatase